MKTAKTMYGLEYKSYDGNRTFDIFETFSKAKKYAKKINRKSWDTYHNIILQLSQYSAFWETPPKDSNLKALRDPLGTADNSNDHKKWQKTYEIAGKVIVGDISDPANGATHYYDDSIDPPFWAKDFKIKIENLNFFYSK